MEGAKEHAEGDWGDSREMGPDSKCVTPLVEDDVNRSLWPVTA